MKTYLITTHHNRFTRWPYVKQHLEEAGIEFTPILAVDWRLFRYTELNEKQYKHESLTLAYYQAAQTAIFNDDKCFVILEDDICISDFTLYQTRLVRVGVLLRRDADLVYLSLTEHNKMYAFTSRYNDDWVKVVRNYWETPATLWTRAFAEKFISYISAKLERGIWLGHIDHELVQMQQSGKYNFYAPTRTFAYGLSSVKQDIIPTEGAICNDTGHGNNA